MGNQLQNQNTGAVFLALLQAYKRYFFRAQKRCVFTILLCVYFSTTAFSVSAQVVRDLTPLSYDKLPEEFRVHPQLLAPVGDQVMQQSSNKENAKQSLYDVTGFRIIGLRVIDPERLLPLLSRFKGKQRTIQDLYAATGTVANALRNHGFFLANAYLLDAFFADGVVTISVLIGRVEQVRIGWSPQLTLPPDVVDRLVTSVSPGSVVSDTMVQYITSTFFDLTGYHATTRFQKGERKGSSKLVIFIQPANTVQPNS